MFPIFMAFVTERSLFFALHTHGLFEGNVAPSHTVRSWKIWPFIFTPYISPKPLFLPKIVTQSPIFFTLSRILEIFHSKTPNRLEFEKKVPKCSLFLWLLSLKDPLFFALHTHGLFEGNVAPSHTVRSWKISYSRNRMVQFGEYFQVQI